MRTQTPDDFRAFSFGKIVQPVWSGLFTPVYATIGSKLVESLKIPTVVNDHAANEAFPLRPMSQESARQRALSTEGKEFATTRWQDVVSSSRGLRRFGGEQFGNFLQRIRGFIGLLASGPRLGRNRRNPVELEVGDTLNCWRVENLDTPHVLRVYAEMRLPGRA